MNEPKEPDDARNWDSIDIYLFSNGQQYSPPRKYHLRSDELKWWDATIHYLARCQYGPTHSNIELFTLDGKKIESPLELKNDAAYVAIMPPDSFIPAGYELYLIKASRSREKRQEQLLNSNTAVKLVHNKVVDEINNICSNSCTDGQNIETVIDSPKKESSNVNKPIQKTFNTTLPWRKKDAKENSAEVQNSKIFKYSEHSAKVSKNKNSLKKKNSPLLNEINQNMNKNNSECRRNASFPSEKVRKNKGQCKPKLQDNPEKVSEIVTKTDEIAKPIRNNEPSDNDNAIFTTDIQTINKTGSNIESKTQALSINSLPKITPNNNINYNTELSFKNRLPPPESEITSNIFEREFTQNGSNVIEKQTQGDTTTFQSKDKQININLNIKLNKYPTVEPKNEDLLIRCKSDITIVSQKTSQVNVNVSLSKDRIDVEKSLVHIEKSSKNNSKNLEDNIFEVGNTKVIIVRCKCNNIEPKQIIQSEQFYREKSNIIIFMPTSDGKELHSNKHDQEVQTSDSINEKPLTAINVLSNNNDIFSNNKIDQTKENFLNKPEEVENKNPEVEIAKQNDLLLPTNKSLIEPKALKAQIEKSTQMDWCNVLLQTRHHEDGRYTFHLPSLDLLKQYNMDAV